jgi:thioredoxin-related protein
MDTVTYPAAGVKEELEHWVMGKVDVSVHPGMARLFGVLAIPEAVAVDRDGRILGRIPDFVEPAAFTTGLRKLRKEVAR